MQKCFQIVYVLNATCVKVKLSNKIIGYFYVHLQDKTVALAQALY